MLTLRKNPRYRATAITALTLFVAACGDDDRLSTAEFVKQGNAICKAGEDKIEAAAAKAFPNENEQPDPVVFKTLANETLIPSVKEQLDGVDALKAPKDLQDAVDRMVADGRAALDKMKADINNDIDAFLENEADPFAEVNKQAGEIGLTVCAEP